MVITIVFCHDDHQTLVIPSVQVDGKLTETFGTCKELIQPSEEKTNASIQAKVDRQASFEERVLKLTPTPGY